MGHFIQSDSRRKCTLAKPYTADGADEEKIYFTLTRFFYPYV